uniref:Meta-cleavage compound hydrolase n=1 Tax=Janibacter sp. OC11 TaxID=1450653 RepID=W6JLT6_9MICO|nr:meta-cleavage compound hydrolase [Janibacter sp. OC11]
MNHVLDPGVERIVDAGGVKTRYWEAGSGEPLILIHGGGAGADARGNWVPLGAPPLPPLPGSSPTTWSASVNPCPTTATSTSLSPHGSSSCRTSWTPYRLSRRHSSSNFMGGATALRVDACETFRITTLTLMGSAGLTREFSAELSTMLDYTEPSVDGMRRIVSALTHPRFQPSEQLIQYRYQLTNDRRIMDAYRATMTWIREQRGLFYPEDDIARVKSKTLVICGREDQVVPLDLSVRFHQLLENSRLYSIPQCGHWAMLEHPEELATAVTDFIKKEETR